MARVFVSVLLAVAAALAAGSGASGAKQYRVAFVADPGGSQTPLGRANVRGLRRAARDFDVEIRVVVQPARTTWTSTFRELARQQYDLVIAPFSQQSGAVVAAANAYPEQRFLVHDSRAAPGFPWPKNVQGYSAREEEIGFVVGYLAGLLERRRAGRDVVGSVGGWPVGSVDRFIAGFGAGARRASPQIRVMSAYAYNFWNPDPCRRIAETQIAKGAGVVFNVAGECGIGTLAAARTRDVLGIGVDQDQSALGPHVLTSAVKDVGLISYRSIELLVQGRLESGGDTTVGLKEGVLRLGRISPRVPPVLIARTRGIERAIVAGRIKDIPTKPEPD